MFQWVLKGLRRLGYLALQKFTGALQVALGQFKEISETFQGVHKVFIGISGGGFQGVPGCLRGTSEGVWGFSRSCTWVQRTFQRKVSKITLFQGVLLDQERLGGLRGVKGGLRCVLYGLREGLKGIQRV